MPAVAGRFATEFPGLEHADFVIGDRDGTTASPALSALICEHLRACGYSVEYNHPYKGVELVRRYGRPAEHRHSLQLEINRKLYMDEQTLEMTQNFATLKGNLLGLVQRLLVIDPPRALALGGREVMVLEAAPAIGTGTSSRNSEVIHAGIYYPQGSLKARLCVEGKQLLYDYCEERGVGYRRCGKLIVATSQAQVHQLQGIIDKAVANGVNDLVLLSGEQARALEPQLACVA
eukprot:gene51642-63136_t